jgi:hypothetical protein
MTKYIAKPNTWFDEGTEVELLVNFRKCFRKGKDYNDLIPTEWGLFRGMCNGELDEETCDFLEFDIIED